MLSKESKAKETQEPKGIAGTAYMLIHDFLYVLAIITVVFVFFARLTGVHGSSMFPTLVGAQEEGSLKGDFLVLQSNVVSTNYKQGDIVVACVPTFENGKPLVKRVIATEGQTVDMHYDYSGDGGFYVFVDGEKLDEPYINGEMLETLYTTIEFPATVPDNCYFLMGDNRNNSNDSRNPQIGMVNRQYIVGKSLFIIFPGVNENGVRDWSRIGPPRSAA